ncbi:putative ATP-dependent helicase IRC5 [Meyerozyma sp. JA9]|nr:putative ATP-dependent helicase IRC5 [Meyerozyma sp. JA9]
MTTEDLRSLVEPQAVSEEQRQFNKLSKDRKLDRLNTLISKSQIYANIIADNIIDNTSKKKRARNESPQPAKAQKTASGKRDILSMLKNPKPETTFQPSLITGGTMKDYQLDGLEWLSTLYENGLNGILADEMGLGKTLQCIAFLSYLISNGVTGPFLVVVPLSTLSGWFNEVQRFAPSMKVLKYTGTKQERQKIKLNSDYNLILTSYEISIRDFTKLNSVSWKYLIVDEGHRLKNSKSLLIKVLKKLDVQNRLLITGTPLQNNLNELWSLLNFILPDVFHDLELFQQWFNFDELTTMKDDEDDDETRRLIELNIQENLIHNLHTILKPFILRRVKKDVIMNLPPKKEYLIHIPLTSLQKKLYKDGLENNLDRSIVEVNLKEYLFYNHSSVFKYPRDEPEIDAYLQKAYDDQNLEERQKDYSFVEEESDEEFERKSPRKSKPKSARMTRKQKIIDECFHKITKHTRNLSLQNTVVQLRSICNSPYTFYEPFPLNETKTSIFMEVFYKNSAKIQVLDQLINELLPDHKLLIFSQFTKMLDLLHDWLDFKNIRFCRLDGSTSHEDRETQIDQFNTDKSKKVFLLSTRAGGLGINLTAADTVVLFDNDWNPQVDLQAIDRVHRIGQKKPVKIYRFLIKNSVEEILISKSYSKRFLEKLVIQMGQFEFNKFSKLLDNTEETSKLSLKNLLEVSKNFQFSGETEKGSFQVCYGLDAKPESAVLTETELSELNDRSLACYETEKDYPNITVYETTNNMDNSSMPHK